MCAVAQALETRRIGAELARSRRLELAAAAERREKCGGVFRPGPGAPRIRVDSPAMLPPVTVPSAFAARRNRLSARFCGPALFVSGLSRPRNFAGNRYPFRAESHFL